LSTSSLLSLDDLSQRPWLAFADQKLDFLLFPVLIPELLEQHLVQPLYRVCIA
jgi:hypothetical protein